MDRKQKLLVLVLGLGVLPGCAPDKLLSFDGNESAPRLTVDEIHGRVSGASGALSGAIVTVALSEATGKKPTVTDLGEGRLLHTEMLLTDTAGRYTVSVPEELRRNPLLRIAVVFEYPGYLRRTIGPVPVSDFDGREITNAEALWLLRQMSRNALRETILRQGREVSGRVLLSDGSPAVGATVVTSTKYVPYSWKFPDQQAYSASNQDTTDDQGRFIVLADQRATIRITLDGYAPLVIDNLPQPGSTNDGDAPQTFQLPKSIRPHGRVLTFDGKPIPYAIVRAQRDTAWNEFDMPLSLGRLCVADVDGNYELPPLPLDAWKFTVNTRLQNPDQAAEANRLGESGDSYQQISYAPLSDVILVQKAKLDESEESPAIDFRAIESNTITVRIELPGGKAAKVGRAPLIPVQGQFNGERWSGISIPLAAYDAAVFTVPHGVEEVVIGTGLGRVQRGPGAPFEIGEALPIGRVDEDLSGFVVRLPQLARLTVQTKLPEELGAGRGISVTYDATYVASGYSGNGVRKERLRLSGTMQTDNTQFRGWALPDEEIELSIRVLSENRVLHEQRFKLEPGENREVSIDLSE